MSMGDSSDFFLDDPLVDQHSYGKSTCLVGSSAISMAILAILT